MKILLSKKTIAMIALVMLLSLSAVASMTIIANAVRSRVEIEGNGSVTLISKNGKSQTYSSDSYANFGGLDTVTIIPDNGWNISDVTIDGNSQVIEDEDGFSLYDVNAKNVISVIFLKNPGKDDVDVGDDSEAYPCPEVGLIFLGYVSTGGYAYADLVEWYPQPVGESWDIYTIDVVFEGDVVQVTLVLSLDEVINAGLVPEDLKLWRTEVWLARADVNEDGMINGTDVSIVANANPSAYPDWEERYNQNEDLVINDDDVNIVNNYIGETVWEDITLWVHVDYDNRLVYVHGETDHFSIFGAHWGEP